MGIRFKQYSANLCNTGRFTDRRKVVFTDPKQYFVLALTNLPWICMEVWSMQWAQRYRLLRASNLQKPVILEVVFLVDKVKYSKKQ